VVRSLAAGSVRTGGGIALMSVVAGRSGKGNFKEDAASYIDELYRVAFHLTKKRDDADDLVQETYLRAVKNYGQFETGTNLKAWLTRMLYNLFVNRYHRDKKSVSIDQPVSDTATTWLDNMESNSPGPEAAFLQTELKEKLKNALDDLPEDFSTPIVLVDIGGFSYSEAAEVISCPVGTVRSRLFRARNILADKLREYVRHEK
jgi:RNA polymerase sigma factor (sigma-70 family)